MTETELLIILIAPNVSEQMGGEGIKALKIFTELKKAQPRTLQITHERNRQEVQERLELKDVYFVRDDWVMAGLWKTVLLRWLIDLWFQHKALRLAKKLAMGQSLPAQNIIIHQTEPNSPVLPRLVLKEQTHVFGPINGNIYWPKPFWKREKLRAKLRRYFHFPLQRLNRWFNHGLKQADLILVAGGDRTRNSLLAAGCLPQTMVDSVDYGIEDTFGAGIHLQHVGVNPRFVHFGRLVAHKGTQLIIRSLRKTQGNICLDIIGRGPELQRCRELVDALYLQERVRFLDWYDDREDLFRSFSQYRGMVLPTLEDANGIAVQEAMTLGLPPICLDWGGPQLLIKHGQSGYLVQPESEAQILRDLAQCMDTLSEDGELAQQMSEAAKAAAQAWKWSRVITDWQAFYRRAVATKGAGGQKTETTQFRLSPIQPSRPQSSQQQPFPFQF
ncbi:MAG: glycosyltransferase family 4 protein [Spirulinaceae cyanobacterium]